MSKKITAASQRLIEAIEKHAEVVGGNAVTLKKAQRAAAEAQVAAIEYAITVREKTGVDTPFPNMWNPGLEESTIASLKAERDELAKKTKHKKKDH